MTNDVLIEIGTEELPVSFIGKAVEAMPALMSELLSAARVGFGEMHGAGTPRRLSLVVKGVADAQQDLAEDVMGPPKSVAMDAQGTLTKAGEAFVRKAGKTAADVRVVETPKGPYVALRREEKGVPTREILPRVVHELCSRIPFQKSMRWGEGDVAFGRPIHWLVALYGTEVIPAQFAGVNAGRTTRGHRFLAPTTFEISRPDAYVDALRKAHVMVDIAARKKHMHDELLRAAERLGCELVEDAFLLEECASLVEEPFVVEGGFEERYLDIPEDVIVSVMRGHQRYFALRDKRTKKLAPLYLNVVNTANDPGLIRKGNDRVLRARLSDARFFVDEDRKKTLADRVPRLDGIVFQAKLGTIGEKVRRIGALAKTLAISVDAATVEQAAQLAKADLVSLIVGEFPELQGTMGRWYAQREGIDPQVAGAIEAHYQPKSASDSIPQDILAAALAVADRADSLVGCFGIGQVPSGSADPFGLRRATLGIIRIGLEGPFDVHVRTLLDRAYEGYAGKKLKSKADVLRALDEFVRARLRALYGEKARTDVIDACLLAWNGESVRDLDARIGAVEAFRGMPEFESLSVAFKRCFNIAKEAAAEPPDASLFEAGAEETLGKKWQTLESSMASHVAAGRYQDALHLIAKELRQPIDTYFEKVFVMVEDPKIRDNRLKLLGSIARAVTRIAHVHILAS